MAPAGPVHGLPGCGGPHHEWQPGGCPGISARHVVVIGIDGLSPDGIQKGATPQLHQLMKSGASTLHARAVMPTVSSPNWASMIMGAGPEQHGITTNDWEVDKFEIAPTAVGPGGCSRRSSASYEPADDSEDRLLSRLGGIFTPVRKKRPPILSNIPRGPCKPVCVRSPT